MLLIFKGLQFRLIFNLYCLDWNRVKVSNQHAKTPPLRKGSSFLQLRHGNFQECLFLTICSTTCHFKNWERFENKLHLHDIPLINLSKNVSETLVSPISPVGYLLRPYFMYTFVFHFDSNPILFWSWVFERSLERKKLFSADRDNLLDFDIFSILSYQYYIIDVRPKQSGLTSRVVYE